MKNLARIGLFVGILLVVGIQAVQAKDEGVFESGKKGPITRPEHTPKPKPISNPGNDPKVKPTATPTPCPVTYPCSGDGIPGDNLTGWLR